MVYNYRIWYTTKMRFIGICIVLGSLISNVFAESNNYVSRAEALILIYSTKNTNVQQVDTSKRYADVTLNQWYTSYMYQAVADGLLSPNPQTGLLYPHQEITRSAWLKFLTEGFNLPTNLPQNFTDVSQADWALPYAGLAKKLNAFNSANSTHLYPYRLVTYDEAAATINTLLQRFPQLRVSKKVSPTMATSQFSQSEFTRETLDTSTPVYNKIVATQTVQTAGFVNSNTIRNAVINLLQKQDNIADTTRDSLLVAVNKERSANGLGALQYNNRLEDAAQAFAHDMWKRGYFSHFTPEGESFVDRIRAALYFIPEAGACTCSTPAVECKCTPVFSVGENIAKGQSTVAQVMQEWMASPGHRKNILQPKYTEIGFGLYGNVWVQNFGSVQFIAQDATR